MLILMAEEKDPVTEYKRLQRAWKKGGKKGGKATVPKGFSAMDAERRSEIAKKAAAKRWKSSKEKP